MSLYDADQVPECVSVQHNIHQGPAIIPCCQPLHLVLPCAITKQGHDDIIICQVNLQEAAAAAMQRARCLTAAYSTGDCSSCKSSLHPCRPPADVDSYEAFPINWEGWLAVAAAGRT